MRARLPYEITKTPRIKEMLPYLWSALIEQRPPYNDQFEKDKEYNFINVDKYYGKERMAIRFSEPVYLFDFSPHAKNLLADKNELNIAFKNFLANRVKNEAYNLPSGLYQLETGEWFYLTHQIAYRPKKNFKTGEIIPRYSVVANEMMGKGSFGQVSNVLNTLGEDAEGYLTFDNSKQRAVKIQFHREKESIQDAIEEAEISSSATHLASKPLVVTDEDYTFLGIRKFPGKSLDKLKKEIAALTIEDRLFLTKKILQALQEQIHDRDIVHRDIKPENIMVDLNTMEVNFIDLGLSVKNKNIEANRKETDFIGTTPYMSTEALTNDPLSPIDKASDISSIGLTLASALWGAETRKLGFPPIDDDLFKDKARAMYKAYVAGEEEAYLEIDKEKGITQRTLVGKTSRISVLKNLLQNIDERDLSINERNEIANFFASSIAHDKSARPSLDSAIALFDTLLTVKELQKFSDNEKAKISEAHEQGVKAHRALRLIAKPEEDQPKPLKNSNVFSKLKTLVNPLRQKTSNKKLEHHPIREIENVIANALVNVDDSPDAIREFTQTLGITIFSTLTTKEEIRQKTIQTFDDFYKKVEALLALAKERENEIFLLKTLPLGEGENQATRDELIQDLNGFVEDIVTVLEKHTNRIAKLDDIDALNRYFAKRIDDFTAADGRIHHLDLDNRFQDPSMLPQLKMYRQIFHHAPTQNANELQQLKDKISYAIKKYVDKTLTHKNINKQERAASPKRLENIKKILAAVETAQNEDELIKGLEKELKSIRSIFGVDFKIFHARSELHDLISSEIKDYKNSHQPAASPRGVRS